MHETVPQPRSVALSTPDSDEEYEVYYFYPSRNRIYQVCPHSFSCGRCHCPHATVGRQSILAFRPVPRQRRALVCGCLCGTFLSRLLPLHHHLCFTCQLSFPSYSYNSDFVFPDPAAVHGISTLGYSVLFRRGLWAQVRLSSGPCCICTYTLLVPLLLPTAGCPHRPSEGDMSLAEEPLPPPPSHAPSCLNFQVLDTSLGKGKFDLNYGRKNAHM